MIDLCVIKIKQSIILVINVEINFHDTES